MTGLQKGPLGPVIGPIVEQLVFKVVIKGIEYFARKMGIIEEEEKAEEVGYRVEEAEEHEDWMRQENFPSFEEYYAYLKKQIPDTEIAYAKLKENRDRYMALGTMELTKATRRSAMTAFISAATCKAGWSVRKAGRSKKRCCRV